MIYIYIYIYIYIFDIEGLFKTYVIHMPHVYMYVLKGNAMF